MAEIITPTPTITPEQKKEYGDVIYREPSMGIFDWIKRFIRKTHYVMPEHFIFANKADIKTKEVKKDDKRDEKRLGEGNEVQEKHTEEPGQQVSSSCEDKKEEKMLDENITARCMKCKKQVEIDKPEKVTMKNGLDAMKGICHECGTKVFRILGKKTLDDKK